MHIRNGNFRLDSGDFESWGAIRFRPDLDLSGDDIIQFLDSDASEVARFHSNGNFGIGESNPQANLHVDGTTKLGSTSPAIKMKKISGTTSNNANGSVTYNHGLANSNQILGIDLFVNNVTRIVPAGDHPSNPDKYYYHLDPVDPEIIITSQVTSASGQGLSGPFTLLIIYEE